MSDCFYETRESAQGREWSLAYDRSQAVIGERMQLLSLAWAVRVSKCVHNARNQGAALIEAI